jgi:hypothetical protein
MCNDIWVYFWDACCIYYMCSDIYESRKHGKRSERVHMYACVHVDPLTTNMACTTDAIQEHAC